MKRLLGSYLRFIEHLHAREIRPAALRFANTFHAGMLSAILFVLLTVTGILLMYVYVPSEGEAWESMRVLEERSRYGSVVRSLHNIAAQLMIGTVALHLVSLVLRRANTRPKLANWLVGVTLCGLTVVLSYTGYLLPFDQLAYWAITVGANMAASAPGVGDTMRLLLLGSEEISTVTLLRFYVHHCITLPLVFVALLSLHLYRIRRDRGLSIRGSDSQADARVLSWPAVVRWELLIFVLVSAALIVLSCLHAIPLGPKANPEVTPNPMKAPWYLVALQELLHFHHPFLVSYLLPTGVFVFVCCLPVMPDRVKTLTLSDLSRRAWSLLLAGLGAVIAVEGLAAYHVNATLILTSLLFGGILVWSRLGARGSEVVGRVPVLLFVLVHLIVSYLCLTMVALYLRGPNWSLLL